MQLAQIRDPLRWAGAQVFVANASAESKRLYWTIGAVAIAALPHVPNISPLIVLLAVGAALWRIVIEARAWRLPPKWLRFVIALSAMLMVAASYRTLNGLEAGTALLTLMAGVKLLETQGTRDCTMMLFIGFVLLFAALLYNQGLLQLPYVMIASWILAAALLRIHQSARPATVRNALRITGAMILQALPIAVLLFIFFPRLPGQFWALPARGNATTGLDDEMTPGDISELSIASDPAFRVRFDGALPPPSERYWRGPVLHDFDGRRWKREPGRFLPNQRVIASGKSYTYRITLEPTQRNWLIALDVPTDWSGTAATRTYDWQLITRRPISTLASFTLTSHTSFAVEPELPRTMRSADTALPGAANPRTREFAQLLRATVTSDAAYIEAVLSKFRSEEYFYTLTPPFLGDDSADDFLFQTRSGFCEHYASAFAVLMRAAGIPARVITGYQGGEFNTLGEYLLVRQSDAHAWNEVWLEDRGWVRVDPTGAVAPERIERNLDAAIAEEESVPGRFLRRNVMFANARLAWDAVNNFWNNRIVEYDDLKQQSLMAWLGIEDADWRDLGVAFAVSLIAFFVAMTLYLGWLFRPRRRDPLVNVYEQLCRKLSRAHLPREPYEGPVDYLRRAASAKPSLAHTLQEIRTTYIGLRYGPDPIPNQLSRLKYLVNMLRV